METAAERSLFKAGELIAGRYEIIDPSPQSAVDHSVVDDAVVEHNSAEAAVPSGAADAPPRSCRRLLFTARDRLTNRTVVLQFLPGADRHAREAAALLRSVAHPALLRVFDAQLHGDRLCLIMEAFNRKDEVAAAEAPIVLLKVCEALVSLHRAGLFYGDLSSEDVALSLQGELKLLPPCPFGLPADSDRHA